MVVAQSALMGSAIGGSLGGATLGALDRALPGVFFDAPDAVVTGPEFTMSDAKQTACCGAFGCGGAVVGGAGGAVVGAVIQDNQNASNS